MKSIKMVPISDYVSLKMEVDRLNEVVSDLTDRLMKVNTASTPSDKGIIISNKTNSQYIKVADIAMIKSCSNYSTIYLTSGKEIFTSKTLKYWIDKCQAAFLYRIHNSYIINCNKIVSFEPSKRQVEVEGGHVAIYNDTGKKLLNALKK